MGGALLAAPCCASSWCPLDLPLLPCVQDITNSIWAFAALFHRPSQELLNGVALYLLRHWPRFKASEVAHALLALALLRSCSLQTWDLLVDKLAAVPPSSFDDVSLEQLFQTCSLIDAAGEAC